MAASQATILTIDDERAIRENIAVYLEDSGYRVLQAENGRLGIEVIHQKQPDLVLVDLRMPEVDGLEVLANVRKTTPETPIIVVSGAGMLKDAIEALRLGAWDYILKPVHDMGILTHAVSRALERARLLAENKQFYKQLHDQNIQLQQEITRRRHAEEELLELNQQLQAANASKDKFFSIIAHDLRSPFTALIGLTEAIVEDIDAYSKDRIKSILHRLHESSKQVYTLLTNLLTWSRLQRGLIEHHVEQVPLNGIVSYIINLFSAAARQKQITLKNQVPAGLSVYADQNMVNTIIRNLISNALKFTGPNGTITVSARQGEKTVEVAVSDTGIGMNQEEMEKIFRIDAKYSKPGTAGEEGTGLGLILCQELVQKNGGSIRVDSEPGQGTTFTIHLPGVPD